MFSPLFLSLLSTVFASTLNTRQAQLQWVPCDAPGLHPRDGIFCSSLQVPLDYNNPAAGTATLAVAKIQAVGTRRGTIFVSSTGLGYGGVEFLNRADGERVFNATGRSFDLISWDPRGTGYSNPSVNCFPSSSGEGVPASFILSEAIFNATRFIIKSTGPSEDDISAFLGKTASIEGVIKQFIQDCVQRHSAVFPYIGTAATVRDVVALADAVEGRGGKINYYGLGYGTVIGTYLMKMFPDRLGRIVLDGVVDAEAYTSKAPKLINTDAIQDAGKGMQVFYDACARIGPPLPSNNTHNPGCAFALSNSTAQEIEQRAKKTIDDSYDLIRAGIQHSWALAIQSTLSHITNTPRDWYNYAGSLKSSEEGVKNLVVQNLTRTGSTRRHVVEPRSQLVSRQAEQFTAFDKRVSAVMAISCGDAPDTGSTTTKDIFDETIRISRDESSILGPLIPLAPEQYCHLWPARAVERNIDISSINIPSSVLVIGNTIDSNTPLGNAIKLVQKLNKSGSKKATLIQHDSVGYTSLALRSLCTESIVRRYYEEGKVPESDTLCGLNEAPNFQSIPEQRNLISTSTISAPLPSATGSPSTSNGTTRTRLTLPMTAVFALTAGFVLFG